MWIVDFSVDLSYGTATLSNFHMKMGCSHIADHRPRHLRISSHRLHQHRFVVVVVIVFVFIVDRKLCFILFYVIAMLHIASRKIALNFYVRFDSKPNGDGKLLKNVTETI